MYLQGEKWRCFNRVELADMQPGVYLVVGDNRVDGYAQTNAVGKTSLANLFTWALYGKHPDMVAKKSVIPFGSPAGTTASGTVEVTRGSQHIRVHRSRTRSTQEVKVTVNGTTQEWDPSRTDAEIVKLLGADYDRFCQLLIYNGNTVMAGASDAVIKAMISSLIPIDITPAMKPVNEKLRAAELAKAATFRAIQENETNQQHQQSKIANYSSQVQQWEAERAERRQAIVAALETERTNHHTYLSQIASLDAQIQEASKAADVRTDLMISLQHERDMEKTSAMTVTNLKTTIKDLTAQSIPTVCDTCGQNLPADAVAHVEGVRSKQLADFNGQLVFSESDHKRHRDSIQRIEADLHAMGPDTCRSLETARNLSANEATRIAGLVTKYETDLATLDTSENPYTVAWNDASTELASLQEQHNTLLQEQATNEKSFAMWKYMAQLTSTKGLRHFALANLLPSISYRASVYLARMVGNAMNVAVTDQTSTGTEKFQVVTKDDQGTTWNFKDYSGGQRRRVGLGLFLSMYDHAVPTLFDPGFLIVDEMLDSSTDHAAKSAMLELLAEYAQTTGRVILVITNDQVVTEERGYVSGVVKVTKETTGSTAVLMSR